MVHHSCYPSHISYGSPHQPQLLQQPHQLWRATSATARYSMLKQLQPAAAMPLWMRYRVKALYSSYRVPKRYGSPRRYSSSSSYRVPKRYGSPRLHAAR